MVSGRLLITVALLAASSPALAGPPPAAARPRFVSSQAYYHAIRAELALAQNDLAPAAEELQLALVYDADSRFLSAELARVCLRLGWIAKAEKMADRAIALDTGNAESWRLRAHVFLAKGEALAAERALRRSLEHDPSAPAVAVELAKLLEKRGKLEDALAVLSSSADRAPRSTEALAATAALELSRKRIAAAAHALERALDRDPRSVPLTTALVAIYERQARYADAAQRWRRVVELVPDDVEALTSAARAELWLEDDDAADRYVRSIQWMTRGPELDQRLGLLYMGEGRVAQAVAHLADAVRGTPSDQRIRFTYAVALEQLGKHEAALAELELIGPENELYVDARVRIGHILLSLGRFDRARLAVRGAMDRQPRAVPLIAFVALLSERSGKTEEALATLRAARREMPQELELAETEAEILIRSGERDRGIRLFRAAVEAAGEKKSEDALYRLGSLYQRAGEAEAAVEMMQRILRDTPESARALNMLGFLWAERGVRLDDSVKLLRRALAIDPRSGHVLDSLGWALYRQNKLEESEAMLKRAAHLLPNDPEVAEHLGDVALAKGAKETARNSYVLGRAALERAEIAKEPDAKSALDRLRRKLAELPGPARAEP